MVVNNTPEKTPAVLTVARRLALDALNTSIRAREGAVCVRAPLRVAARHACHGAARKMQARKEDPDLPRLRAQTGGGFAGDRHCREGA